MTTNISANEIEPGDQIQINGIWRTVFLTATNPRVNIMRVVFVCPRELPDMPNGGNYEWHGNTRVDVKR